MQATTTVPAAIVREWEDVQRRALRTAGSASLMVARGLPVTVVRMDVPALREWAWLTDEWEGRTYGDLRGYVLTDFEGRELGVVLQRSHHAHAEWRTPEGDYEFAGQVRTLQIAANYVIDRHDHLDRLAGLPPRHQDDAEVRDQLVRMWWTPRVELPRVAAGTQVVYTGSLAEHYGEEFTAHRHSHMYDVTDLDDDCRCAPDTRYTLVSLDGNRALCHVSRDDFERSA